MQAQEISQPMRLLRVRQVAEKLGCGVSTVWSWQKTDPTFPRPVKIGQRVTAWKESDLDSWINGAQDGDEV